MNVLYALAIPGSLLLLCVLIWTTSQWCRHCRTRMWAWARHCPNPECTEPRRWRAVWRCAACYKQLTNRERMYSSGVCPHCGEVTDGTIVGATKEAEVA